MPTLKTASTLCFLMALASPSGFAASPSQGFAAFSPSVPLAGLEPLPCFTGGDSQAPSAGVPCTVKKVLEEHCSTCHDSATDSQIGRLDLSRWLELGDGTFDFPHQNENGRQHTRAETFARILDEITTSDASERMPLGDQLSTTDLETLKAWASKN